MKDHPTTSPYPTEAELKATRAHALVALLVICATIIALVVMLTLQLAGVSSFHGATFIAVLFGGVLAVIVTAALGARKQKGRAKNLTGHPPTRAHQIITPDRKGQE